MSKEETKQLQKVRELYDRLLIFYNMEKSEGPRPHIRQGLLKTKEEFDRENSFLSEENRIKNTIKLQLTA